MHLRRLALALAAALAQSPGAHADGERAGAFDYYVLALSWQPSWCAEEGDAREAAFCAKGAGRGWAVHGLWPQNERGWPSYCPTSVRPPSRAMTAAQADIFGSGGAAWYQWKKHGSCAGIEAEAYYELVRRAYGAVERPEVFRRLPRTVALPAGVVEEAFIEANPALEPDMITITCKNGRIQEARICLTRDLQPRVCGPDVVRDCRASDAEMAPLR